MIEHVRQIYGSYLNHISEAIEKEVNINGEKKVIIVCPFCKDHTFKQFEKRCNKLFYIFIDERDFKIIGQCECESNYN